MSKFKKKLHNQASEQGTLFDTEISEGALDVSLAFRDELSKAISKCKESRYQIAAKISELAARNISKDMLDKCTSSNQDYGLRAELLPAVLMATGSTKPAQVLVEPLGCDIVAPHESKLVQLARLEQEKSTYEAAIARLRQELGIK